MVNYQNGKIYKLVSFQTDKIYIGSTCESLAQRKAKHIAKYKRYLRGIGYKQTSFHIIQFDDAEAILLENYPCDTKEQLHSRERYYIENNVCVNKFIPTRTQAEYYEDNREKKIKFSKEYYEKNKYEIGLKTKQYREEHKDAIKETQQKYYQQNKEKIQKYKKDYQELNKKRLQEKRKEKFICECGAETTVKHKARHFKSIKHIEATKPQ
jgi:hypothetical protein